MRRSSTRLMIVGGVAAVLAAAFLFAVPANLTGSTDEPVIDTGARVDQTQCVPCHVDLGDVNVPGIKFSHGNHLLVSCEGCHSRMPHQDGVTERIPMEVCFACHGVQHGPQGELATGECEDCHTPSFDLRPGSHTKDWAKKPHATTAERSGVNGCMMCHEGKADCDGCHQKEKVDVGPMPNEYHSIIQPRPKGPSIKIYPEGPVSMSQCVYCHPDLDDITPGRIIFAHAAHLQRNYRCEACHPTFAHSVSGVAKPDMLSCYRCHGLQHATKGQVASEECEKCHPKQFDLTPTNHTKAFVKGEHKEMFDKDPAYCAMCHSSKFCVDCHRGKKVSPNAPGKMVIPADHKNAKWLKQHGPQYMQGEGACGSCHDDKSCKRCHKTPMPHPVDWAKDHRPPPGIPADDCNICHQDRRECQNCHHSGVRTADLVRKNCVPCHDEMKQVPATAIQNKGFAEHAVHFDVEKTKGRPYRCYECHVDFGSSKAAQSLEIQQGHDLRLCYGCHGALDPMNALIAPYPGKALCVRCHTDLGV